jgi:hypothetical protein
MALDAGYIQYQATLDLTGANSVSLGEANCPQDIFEIGVELVTASGADTLAVQFREQSPPTGSAGGTQIGVVTGPAATIVAAGKCVKKNVNYRAPKGARIWATVTDATTGATNARVYVKAYPAGESAAESVDIASTT